MKQFKTSFTPIGPEVKPQSYFNYYKKILYFEIYVCLICNNFLYNTSNHSSVIITLRALSVVTSHAWAATRQFSPHFGIEILCVPCKNINTNENHFNN